MKNLPEIVFIDPHRKNEVDTFLAEWFDEKEYMEVQSSGSTGAPKLIRIQKEHMRVSARKTIAFFNLKEGDSSLHCLSLATIGGKMMLVRAILANMKIIVGKVAAHALEDLNFHVSFAAIVPIQLDYQLQNNPKKVSLIDTIIVGGAAISLKTEQFLRTQKLSVYQTFGMTETISHVALRKVGFDEEHYFTGLENISFSTEEGQLVIHYPEIGQNHLKSTDIVELISPNTFKWLGRADFVINSGGIKLFPEQIEEKLSKFIPQAFFVMGVPDEKLGQKVVLYVEGFADFNLSDLRPYLDKYEVPKEIRILEKFVRTKSEKINRIASATGF